MAMKRSLVGEIDEQTAISVSSFPVGFIRADGKAKSNSEAHRIGHSCYHNDKREVYLNLE